MVKFQQGLRTCILSRTELGTPWGYVGILGVTILISTDLFHQGRLSDSSVSHCVVATPRLLGLGLMSVRLRVDGSKVHTYGLSWKRGPETLQVTKNWNGREHFLKKLSHP